MSGRRALLSALGWSVAFGATPAWAQRPGPKLGELKSLGNDRYQIGKVVVDKHARSFTVPGRVHVLGQPLEYLATSPGGVKDYETLLEVDASGSEFNLACILIGLERDPRQLELRKTKSGPLVGPRVRVSVAWTQDSRRVVVPAAEAILNPEAGVPPESVEWVYVGSLPAEDGRPYVADVTGTLIGFVPNEANIIESARGIGIGAYGSVRGKSTVPPVGTAIELIVDAAPLPK